MSCLITKGLLAISLAGVFVGTCAYASDGIIAYAVKQGLRQGALLLKAEPIEQKLKDPLLPGPERKGLELSQEIIDYAHNTLQMDVKKSYRRFVELDHDWVTQVVTAAERDQLKVLEFHFPIAGSFPYKGFFDESDAIEFADSLSDRYDVYRRKAIAFSSLGWFSDPITSNLLTRESLLMDVLFHELVHLNFYFSGEGDFDEAFATWFSSAVAPEFAKTSTKIQNREMVTHELESDKEKDNELRIFLDEIIKQGNDFYAKRKLNPTLDRAVYFSWIKACSQKYPQLERLKGLEWNNATVLSFATYFELIPHIQQYADKHKLTPAEFLKLVKSRGVKIVQEIAAEKIPDDKSLCGSVWVKPN